MWMLVMLMFTTLSSLALVVALPTMLGVALIGAILSGIAGGLAIRRHRRLALRN
jgi:hypothetical protein